ncbi:MAG: excinuclease ABC subunit UvrB [Candidatus Pacebacteria bacterium]|nr:excinuclease ABC subunit UvrB [Candidatus Paceibacterota bacterium]MDD4333556.1 excinuclease ABC subunit UvrB [Candidatus Paceibacterota bacterium]
MDFNLKSEMKPKGDQVKAIKELLLGLKKGFKKQTLLGVTGSGKTFTIANVIDKIKKPTLVISHNKTLAAQLCNEFREFFPDNAVEYFVSYYDYFQPESYLPRTDTYIEKEAQINDEIDRLRHASTQALLTRKDVIIVSSVSAIYGLGSPKEYEKIIFIFKKGEEIKHKELAKKLIEIHFERTTTDLKRGTFRLRGQVLEVMPVNEKVIYRFIITDKIEKIEKIDYLTREFLEEIEAVSIFPATHYIINEEEKISAIKSIREELEERLEYFKKENKLVEYERLKKRVNYDLEMIENIGYCQGIENYSAHFDKRKKGEPPFTLLDYFKNAKEDFLIVIDESHVTLPQIRAMYNGDKARKTALIDNGFRLPSAYDNRPLTYLEFNNLINNIIYVSATPAEEEMTSSENIVEQIVRPTGLIDPIIDIRPIVSSLSNLSQVDDLILEIEKQVKKGEKTLVTTLSKRMAEDLTSFLEDKKFKVKYLHSDIKTLDRVGIITDLRKGLIDIIVGVNLIREGLDIPEVSLVAILDADKEGFLRNETSLIQTIGRAARNENGRVILYADNITDSIKKAISETDRRREVQVKYNKENNITPKTIKKNITNILDQFNLNKSREKKQLVKLDLLGDGRSTKEILREKKKQMAEAAERLEFELAALLRDEVKELEKEIKKNAK